ncbi:MAG: S-layer homology domain-containing protein [Oscillospiraceae bacterium]|nr:S-layer homology domain-containing protein [Oscillospiraceae bacterium]
MHCTGYYGECRRRQHRTQTQPDGDSIVTKQDLTVAEPKTGETAEIEVPTLTDENKYVAQVGEIKYTSVKAAIEAAVNGQTVELLRSVTVDEPIMVKHSITIDGNGNSITRSTDGIILNVVYANGTNVTVQDLTLAGNNGGGLLQWTMEGSYKENDSPSTTPKLTVKNCTFSSDDGQKTGAGIGLWGHTSGDWFNAAKSEVVIDGCTFDTLSVGIYYNEEAPLLNLKSTVTNNIFKNLSWTGLAGIPANAEIAYNRFEQTCNGAIQYLFNAAQTQTNTYIHDNVIDSKTGIQFMPYHLNEGNQNGGKPTVFVTADMLPRIEKNVRNVDTDLVVLVAYRSATDETFKLAEGVSIDLTKNYTQGVAPTIDVEVQAGAGAPSVDEASAGTRITVTVKPDAGYELDELTVTDAKNKDLKVTKRSETTYTFHMADSKVTVEASFKLIETEPENPFTDISKSDYFYDAVLWAVDKGITSGTSANTFSPDASCTRAQMVTFLWRANASPVVNYAMDFTDVAADAYYAEAVRLAVSEGVTAGTGDKAFSPDADCTRAQIVTFMYRDAR